MSARAVVAVLVLWAGFAPALAAAHPGPAAPPEFVLGECVTVIDRSDTAALELAYNISIEDAVFDIGEIQLPDSKSHQFFAFAGALVKRASSDGYHLFPFDAALDQPLAMPMWLDQDDVTRAEGAAGPIDMTNFTAAQVLADDVLAARPELDAYLLPFGDKSARVPITEEQALMGVSWQLGAVPPGVYTVGGYVFSPPYNDWAVRAGVIKVVDGETAVPAAAIEPIDAFVYAGQGRKITGCVDAPAGSTLRAWVRSEDQPGAAWEPWLEEQPLDALAQDGQAGRFELCLHNPEPGRAGLLRVRVVVTAPDGQSSAAYSPDTVLAVATAAACVESAKTCCPEKQPATNEPGMSDAGSAAGGQGGSAAGPAPSGAGGSGGLPGAGAGATAPGDGPEPAGGTAVGGSSAGGASAGQHAAGGDEDSGGCTVRPRSALGTSAWPPAWLVIAALAALTVRGRSRARRTGTPRDRSSSSLRGTRSDLPGSR
jgi:hypothetical protein